MGVSLTACLVPLEHKYLCAILRTIYKGKRWSIRHPSPLLSDALLQRAPKRSLEWRGKEVSLKPAIFQLLYSKRCLHSATTSQYQSSHQQFDTHYENYFQLLITFPTWNHLSGKVLCWRQNLHVYIPGTLRTTWIECFQEQSQREKGKRVFCI